jgi:NAD-dependent oxidoreductase involved in siderophore biosynthesis
MEQATGSHGFFHAVYPKLPAVQRHLRKTKAAAGTARPPEIAAYASLQLLRCVDIN